MRVLTRERDGNDVNTGLCMKFILQMFLTKRWLNNFWQLEKTNYKVVSFELFYQV